MCGRFLIQATKAAIEEHFDAEFKDPYHPNSNASPSQSLPIITNEDPHEIHLAHFGFIPSWTNDKKISYSMINARAETINEKPAYKKAFNNHRCLIIADGFYEWQKTEDGKIPHLIRMKDQSLFAFAGIWSHWHKGEKDETESFSIITTKPNSLVKQIHDRMPVILKKEDYLHWLDPKLKPEDAQFLLKTFDSKNMESFVKDPTL